MSPEQIIAGGGTAGLILALAYITRELWIEHKRKDLKTEEERDEAIDLAKQAADGTAKVTEGLARLTALVERQARRRTYDDGDQSSKRTG